MQNETKANEQRRRFSRVLFNSSARLVVDDRVLSCELHDVSLKGALLGITDPELGRLVPGCACTLELRLDGEDAKITMNGSISHVEGRNAGVRCQSIDLDSVSHLRRLVELNVGDETVLQRDLSALIALG